MERTQSQVAARRAHTPQAPGCSSLYGFVEFAQENSFLIIGERTNAMGSPRLVMMFFTAPTRPPSSAQRQGAGATGVEMARRMGQLSGQAQRELTAEGLAQRLAGLQRSELLAAAEHAYLQRKTSAVDVMVKACQELAA